MRSKSNQEDNWLWPSEWHVGGSDPVTLSMLGFEHHSTFLLVFLGLGLLHGKNMSWISPWPKEEERHTEKNYLMTRSLTVWGRATWVSLEQPSLAQSTPGLGTDAEASPTVLCGTSQPTWRKIRNKDLWEAKPPINKIPQSGLLKKHKFIFS